MAVEAPSRTIERPTPTERTPGAGHGDFGVLVFNNDYNTVDEVIAILQAATGCPHDEAVMETWEIHNRGRSFVHFGSREECDRAAAIIRTIGIKVSVETI